MILEEVIKSDVSAEVIGTLLENDVIKKLHALAQPNWLLQLLTLPNILIALAVIGIIWWISSHGGKLW